nr:hypothetical protein Iba_chr09dCG9500 [Ipomoea batatas]
MTMDGSEVTSYDTSFEVEDALNPCNECLSGIQTRQVVVLTSPNVKKNDILARPPNGIAPESGDLLERSETFSETSSDQSFSGMDPVSIGKVPQNLDVLGHVPRINGRGQDIEERSFGLATNSVGDKVAIFIL